MSRLASDYKASDTYREPPNFSHQYTSYYYTRLCQLRPEIAIPPAWRNTAKAVARVLDIEQNQLCWVTGTITREAAAKPDIMDDLKKMYHGQAPQHASKYTTPEDKIFIEDEHGRIQIVGNAPDKDLFITGMVVAVIGSQNALGEFEMVEIAYPALAPQVPRSPRNDGGKVAFVSGLLLDDVANEPYGVQLLLEHLAQSPDISRLVICGDSLQLQPSHLSGARMMRPEVQLSSLEELDRLLSALAMLLPVHLMPGESDPVTIAFPQTPFHPAILQNSRSLLESGALTLETNPQRFEIDGNVILGSSGQPVHDLKRYTSEGDEARLCADGASLDLELLHKTLRWRHLAPTAPDTISSYPYIMNDPLVLSELPHVYFTANSPEFATSVKDNVRLIAVPQFRSTGELVVLNLDNLDVDVISF